MERQKRIYPAKQNDTRLLSGLFLLLSAMLIVSGLITQGGTDEFSIERQPSASEIPMNEAFDETVANLEITLPASSWYAIQVGVFESEELAMQSAEAFRKRGAAGYVWQEGRHRVLAAAYPTQEEAQLVRQQLSEQHSIDSYLYTIGMPEIKLRIGGMQGQLEIFQAAFAHAHDLVAQVQSLSVTMDRQEASAAEVAERLERIRDQIEIVALRMRQRFALPISGTVQSLISYFDHYVAFCKELPREESAISLGMKLKYQTIAMLEQIQQIYHSISDT